MIHPLVLDCKGKNMLSSINISLCLGHSQASINKHALSLSHTEKEKHTNGMTEERSDQLKLKGSNPHVPTSSFVLLACVNAEI